MKRNKDARGKGESYSDASKEYEIPEAPVDDMETRIRGLIHIILDSALKSKRQKFEDFLKTIVEQGRKATDAKSCAIFLLDEDGQILRLKAASTGKWGRALSDREAIYYVPRPDAREPFTVKGKGMRLVEKYLKSKGLTAAGLRDQNKGLMQVVVESGDNIADLVDNGRLPMGITACVARTESPVLRNGKSVRSHPEWRGSYEGAHEVCTSLLALPLVSSDGVVGVIKIENHKDSPSLNSFDELDNPANEGKILGFGPDHERILKILADCVLLAINDILNGPEDTYKKLFGVKLLTLIRGLDVRRLSPVNSQVRQGVIKFYDDRLRTEIEDIPDITSVCAAAALMVRDVAEKLNLHEARGMVGNVGPEFEKLLGTDVRYREHFMHQVQVFLLGYYLINSNGQIREAMMKRVQKLSGQQRPPEDEETDMLRIWFLASVFHDYAYSVAQMDKWLKRYFERVKVPSDPELPFDWCGLYVKYETEKTMLVHALTECFGWDEHDTISRIRSGFLSNDKHDHAVIGSLMILNILQRKVAPSILTESCIAIALHSDEIYSRLQGLYLKDSPFAFLLAYCDTAQQWGRPTIATGIENIRARLENIICEDGQVEIALAYDKVTDQQQNLVKESIDRATLHWHSGDEVEFRIRLSFGGELDPVPSTFRK